MTVARQTGERGLHTHSNKNALRVLHIIESLPPAGAEQALVNLLPCLISRGIDIEVAALWPPYNLADALRENQIAVHELNITSPWRVQEGVPKLRRLIQNKRFDLIHAHLPMGVFYAAMSRKDTPVIATFHGLSFELYPPNTLARKGRRYAEQWWTNRRVDGFIAVSSSVARHYHDTLKIPLDRIHVIPNGFTTGDFVADPQLDKSMVRSRYHVGATDFLVVHVGRLIPQKGHIYLLRALSRLKEQGIKFRALLIGKGPLQSEIESTIALQGMKEMVQLHAPVPHAEVKQVLQVANLFVFPSISEGFGMAAGEAMCMGVPVIASDIPGIASLIEPNVSGLLVPPADAESLARTIRRAIFDPQLRAQLIDGGVQRIRANFQSDIVAAKIAHLYRTTVPTGPTDKF